MPRSRYDDDSDLDDRPRRRRRKPTKKTGPNVALILAIVGVGMLFVIGASVGAFVLLRGKSGGRDLDRFAGRWECTFRDPAGNIYMHKVKEIVGTSETATWYRPDGTVFRVNRVDFRLEERGGKKLFVYFNGWATDERGNGQPFPSGEYIYTLEGDVWTEYDPPGGTIVWTRTR